MRPEPLHRILKDPIQWGFVVFWLGPFLYFWGPWGFGWRDFEIFDGQWWFDTLGHFIFASIATLQGFYLFLTYSRDAWFPLTEYRAMFLKITCIIAAFAVIWELWEAIYDYLKMGAIQAQKYPLDTTLDFAVTGIGVILMFKGYQWRNMFYKEMHPETFQEEYHHELAVKATLFAEEILEFEKIFKKKIGRQIAKMLRKKILKKKK